MKNDWEISHVPDISEGKGNHPIKMGNLKKKWDSNNIHKGWKKFEEIPVVQSGP